MFADVQHRVKKAGQAPGTPVYTGKQKNEKTILTVAAFNTQTCNVKRDQNAAQLTLTPSADCTTWIHVEGLSDVVQIKNVTSTFNIHPLTVEDILNVEQRPKVEEFENYLFITLKILKWNSKTSLFLVGQVSIIIGKNFVLSFVESGTDLFKPIFEKLSATGDQRLRQQGADYLAYRLIDIIVDEYFVVLEYLGEQIETVESRIITSPTPQNARTIYRLKREVLVLRKAIWPMREAVSHLLYAEETLISQFTRVYLRDVYDHTMQAIDTIETFRDMLSSMLDMYLSGLTIRMNEIMKTLTIITTIFIPITALASIYGMNLPNIPLMKSHWGFSIVSAMMVGSVILMMLYFRRKKWVR